MERIYKFLLAYHSNYVPVLHRFWNIAQFRSKIAHFNLPHLYLVPSLEVGSWKWLCWNFADIFGVRKLESLGYHAAFLRDPTFSCHSRTLTCDRRTDWQIHDDNIYRVSIASCGKNCWRHLWDIVVPWYHLDEQTDERTGQRGIRKTMLSSGEGR